MLRACPKPVVVGEIGAKHRVQGILASTGYVTIAVVESSIRLFDIGAIGAPVSAKCTRSTTGDWLGGGSRIVGRDDADGEEDAALRPGGRVGERELGQRGPE